MGGFYLMAFMQPLVFSPGWESMQVQQHVALRWMLERESESRDFAQLSGGMMDHWREARSYFSWKSSRLSSVSWKGGGQCDHK